jgi:hypothetical protein
MSNDFVEVKDHKFQIIEENKEKKMTLITCKNCGLTLWLPDVSTREELKQRLSGMPACVSKLVKINEETVKKIAPRGGCRSCGKK